MLRGEADRELVHETAQDLRHSADALRIPVLRARLSSGRTRCPLGWASDRLCGGLDWVFKARFLALRGARTRDD